MRKRALRIISGLGGVVAIMAITPSSVFAQDVPTTQDYLNNIWVFIAGVLVFFMQAGFALVEAGLTRAKNVVNIFAKNMADAVVGITAFFATGYAFAFGGGGKWIGDSAFFLADQDLAAIPEGGLSIATTFFFQAVFAATAVTIASGAMAERTKFSAYLVFSAVMCAFIYPVVVHWTWGGGFIAQDINFGDAVSFSDFAGSGIVHMTGGIAALDGCDLPRTTHRQVRRRRQAPGRFPATTSRSRSSVCSSCGSAGSASTPAPNCSPTSSSSPSPSTRCSPPSPAGSPARSRSG